MNNRYLCALRFTTWVCVRQVAASAKGTLEMLSFELSAFGAQSGSTAMHNVALADNCDKSWNIVRPGGAMITVLSDLILAEQLCLNEHEW